MSCHAVHPDREPRVVAIRASPSEGCSFAPAINRRSDAVAGTNLTTAI
jgi:hypothetical protein